MAIHDFVTRGRKRLRDLLGVPADVKDIEGDLLRDGVTHFI